MMALARSFAGAAEATDKAVYKASELRTATSFTLRLGPQTRMSLLLRIQAWLANLRYAHLASDNSVQEQDGASESESLQR